MQISIKIFFILYSTIFNLFALVNPQDPGLNIRITYIANEKGKHRYCNSAVLVFNRKKC